MLPLPKRRNRVADFGSDGRKAELLRRFPSSYIWLFYFWAIVLFFGIMAFAEQPLPVANSITKLRNAAVCETSLNQTIRLKATVCATVPREGLLALQDETGAVLLRLPSLDDAIRPGDQVLLLASNSVIRQARHTIDVSPAPLIDNDGIHGAATKSGSIFLPEGLQPIYVEWFDSSGPEALSLEYEGPHLQRQKVPDSALWHKKKIIGELAPGLVFAGYNRWRLLRLPILTDSDPVTNGIATHLDLSCAARSNDTALVFSGYIKVPAAGIYTFYLTSVDGSRFSVEAPTRFVRVTVTGASDLKRAAFGKALAQRNRDQWVGMEGEVDFAGSDGRSIEIELKGNYSPITVVDGSALSSTNLLHRHLQVQGICEFWHDPDGGEFSEILVPSAGQVQVLPSSETRAGNYSTNDLLTAVGQARRMTQAQAALKIPAKLKGITIAADQTSLVLEDASGGVYVHFDSSNAPVLPAVGQLWEVEGKTDPGDFSPVIFADKAKFLGNAAMPEPIHPTWDQLLNGSLDAEYVEVRGVVADHSHSQLTLLTPDGTVTVRGTEDRPLPQFPRDAPLVGSVVRIRGCFTAYWNWDTRQVNGGTFFLYPATAEVEDPMPSDPFSIPATQAANLLEFNAHASALERTKVAGQIIYAENNGCFLLDGKTGVRLLRATQSPALTAGDLVEAVGFPQLGGPSPVLREARLRTIGSAPVPVPVRLASDGLLDRSHDSTLVQIDATLLSDIDTRRGRTLELQAGPVHFLARLRSARHAKSLLAIGSLVRLTGVYSSVNEVETGANLDPFELLLNNQASVMVLHKPPWWTVSRAIAVAGALAGALGFAFVWITVLRKKVESRTAQLQEEIKARQLVEQHRIMEQERIRVARDLHDELGAGLTEVGILASLLKNPAVVFEKKERYLEQLSDSARTLVTGLDEIVWAINPQYDSVSSLVTYYSLFAERFLSLAGIACRFHTAESVADYPLDSKTRHGLFLAFKEALNNAVRHSGASQVEIEIQRASDELIISIRDNGRGLDSGELPGKDGLAGMRGRLQQLGGECRIESVRGRGTSIEFHLKLNGTLP